MKAISLLVFGLMCANTGGALVKLAMDAGVPMTQEPRWTMATLVCFLIAAICTGINVARESPGPDRV